MHVSLNVLAILDMVDKHGSLISASRYLFKTPAALSYQIQKFEEDLGVKIFDRSGHRVKFTDTGRMIMEQGRTLLEGAKALENNAKKSISGWESELNLLIADHIPFNGILPLLKEFYEIKTNTSLRLTHKNLNRIWHNSDNSADIIIAPPSPPPPSAEFSYYETGKVEIVLVVSQTHPLAFKKGPLKPSDFIQHLRVTVEDEKTSEELILHEKSSSQKQSTIVVNSVETKLSVLLSGLCYGFLPQHIAQKHLKSGELVEKKVSVPNQKCSIYIAWRTHYDGLAIQWWRNKLLFLPHVMGSCQQENPS